MAASVCEPGESAGSVTLEVEGEPGETPWTAVVTPLTVKLTVPEGCVEPRDEGEMVAVIGNVLPSAGDVVDGVSTSVVGVLATVKLTTGETELMKLVFRCNWPGARECRWWAR